jgi:hypothetical protein
MDSIQGGPYSLGALLHFLGLFVSVQLAVYWLVSAFVCWVLYVCDRSIPTPYRMMKPWEVWLLLIPLFNVFWNFRVFSRLSRSFKAYFDSTGNSTVGDCSAKVARWLSLSGVCSLIPPLTGLAGPAYLILLVVYLLRVTELRKKVKP